jgi:DNA-binding MarR family transcriptional regulator
MNIKHKTGELPEPGYDPVSDSFFFQLHRMRKAVFRRTSQLMNKADLHLQLEQLPVLVILKKNKMLSQAELSEITMLDKSSILRSVSNLEKKDYCLYNRIAPTREKAISV